MTETINKIEKTIKEHKLLEKKDKVLVGLSGGADSVFLLTVLYRLKEKLEIELYAAHLNHMLRGEDAKNDENFSRKLCEKLDVKFFSKKADVKEFARKNSISDEEAGRILRYEFFRETAEQQKIEKIATAHNKNDNVETVVMRFIRGTSLSGLSGIPYKNDNIIRPILDISREEIEKYLKEENISFVTDKTNLEPIYSRNKIRLELLVEIEEKYNPNFRETLAKNIVNYSYAADFLKEETQKRADNCVKFFSHYAFANLEKLENEPQYIKRSIISYVIGRYDTSKQVTAQIIEKICDVAREKKGCVDFSNNLRVMALYEKLFFVDSTFEKGFFYEIKDLSSIQIEEYNKKVSFEITQKTEKKPNCIFVDYEKIKGKKITVRSRREGDTFSPSGFGGRKKLKNFFIDEKIPCFLRDSIPVVLADDEIVCILPIRVDNKYKVLSNTREILKIEINEGETL